MATRRSGSAVVQGEEKTSWVFEHGHQEIWISIRQEQGENFLGVVVAAECLPLGILGPHAEEGPTPRVLRRPCPTKTIDDFNVDATAQVAAGGQALDFGRVTVVSIDTNGKLHRVAEHLRREPVQVETPGKAISGGDGSRLFSAILKARKKPRPPPPIYIDLLGGSITAVRVESMVRAPSEFTCASLIYFAVEVANGAQPWPAHWRSLEFRFQGGIESHAPPPPRGSACFARLFDIVAFVKALFVDRLANQAVAIYGTALLADSLAMRFHTDSEQTKQLFQGIFSTLMFSPESKVTAEAVLSSPGLIQGALGMTIAVVGVCWDIVTDTLLISEASGSDRVRALALLAINTTSLLITAQMWSLGPAFVSHAAAQLTGFPSAASLVSLGDFAFLTMSCIATVRMLSSVIPLGAFRPRIGKVELLAMLLYAPLVTDVIIPNAAIQLPFQLPVLLQVFEQLFVMDVIPRGIYEKIQEYVLREFVKQSSKLSVYVAGEVRQQAWQLASRLQSDLPEHFPAKGADLTASQATLRKAFAALRGHKAAPPSSPTISEQVILESYESAHPQKAFKFRTDIARPNLPPKARAQIERSFQANLDRHAESLRAVSTEVQLATEAQLQELVIHSMYPNINMLTAVTILTANLRAASSNVAYPPARASWATWSPPKTHRV